MTAREERDDNDDARTHLNQGVIAAVHRVAGVVSFGMEWRLLSRDDQRPALELPQPGSQVFPLMNRLHEAHDVVGLPFIQNPPVRPHQTRLPCLLCTQSSTPTRTLSIRSLLLAMNVRGKPNQCVKFRVPDLHFPLSSPKGPEDQASVQFKTLALSESNSRRGGEE